MTQTIGILHPGEMGAFVAANAKNSGNTVYWASEGRSDQTLERAKSQGLKDAKTLQKLCQKCDVIISVCPPSAAKEVAKDVISEGFKGLYIEANAIAPQRALHINELMTEAGITFVDGSIIGGISWETEQTWLYLSGKQASQAAEIFKAGPIGVSIISDEIGQASALKMCFAAYTKGSTALLAAIVAAAESLDVLDALTMQWSRNDSTFAEDTFRRVREVTSKAWRFEGEMHEIAKTLYDAGLPGDFHVAAAEVYRRIAPFKDVQDTPPLQEVTAALLGE
ncbi:NAD(P)-dependent oxidoreductase [Phototrophicus methaneseepsis]|uniref:NAD(P)-dependent oxidoreductase n=1 Tax=Phototrophicus methaneseepsis TaxID=2710758 RepID=A0A7S8E9J4_9CHLR|nr:NAD(P)-dependent oxidoreductase [Phototrophicus methaneseepsis]QPC82850.1 NAD(P)-dependent oxidoreductase [Phototrophicus methaneseepsis]